MQPIKLKDKFNNTQKANLIYLCYWKNITNHQLFSEIWE